MEKMQVLSFQCGPLEGGGSYSSLWVHPLQWEDRQGQHPTRGPVPMKLNCDRSVIDALASVPLPAVCELDIMVRVASGNKGQAYVLGAKPVSSAGGTAVSPSLKTDK